MQGRFFFILTPVVIILAAASTVAYFIWWDATHCVICRSRLDNLGRCPNPDCRLGLLTQERVEGQRV
ncbi:MAG: hypothetical protein ACE5KW_04675 [Dehalococcoidia bacterium]